MPVNSAQYNDALQQLMFLYTVDYKPWQVAEGRIVYIPIDGVVSILLYLYYYIMSDISPLVGHNAVKHN